MVTAAGSGVLAQRPPGGIQAAAAGLKAAEPEHGEQPGGKDEARGQEQRGVQGGRHELAALLPRGPPSRVWRVRVAINGGPGGAPPCRLDAWLVTDGRAELIRELRELAAAHGLVPRACDFSNGGLRLVAQPVVHTSHPTFGYVIEAAGRRVVWAPEFFGEFGADGASYTLRGGRQ